MPAFYQQQLIGIILIGPSRALTQLNWEDRDYIKVIAKQLAHYLVLHQAHSELAEAKQFQVFNQMSAFLVHDLKNTLAQLSLILSNAEKHGFFVDTVARAGEGSSGAHMFELSVHWWKSFSRLAVSQQRQLFSMQHRV